MSTATLPNANRVRQIAILVSSVDSAAARQLLLHMPTELAKQVRAMANKLGPVSVAEKRAILAEFQKSAGEGSNQRSQATAQPTATGHGFQEVNTIAAGSGGELYSTDRERQQAADAALRQNGFEAPLSSVGEQSIHSPAASDTGPAWTRLSTEALVRFVNGERTAVIAVVVSQLAPHKAVEVLRQLPRETNRAVLQRLSQLQDIDPNAMSAIDEHLAERLSDYQHRIESEHENTRRLNALLQAAPPELQAEWHELLNDSTHLQSAATASASPSNSTMAPLPTTNPRSTQATIAELYGDVVLTTLDAVPGLANPLAARIPVASPAAASTSAPTAASTAIPASRSSAAAAAPRLDDDRPDILSFAAAQATSAAKSGGAFVPTQHVHFDRLLQLSPQNLATLLSGVDSHTVLLALAGSTPDFMRRFVRMLKPADAKVLTKRLESLGSINLRDVDEAQHRIVEKASDMLAATTDSRRQAA